MIKRNEIQKKYNVGNEKKVLTKLLPIIIYMPRVIFPTATKREERIKFLGIYCALAVIRTHPVRVEN